MSSLGRHVKTVRSTSTEQAIATGTNVTVRGLHLVDSATGGTLELRGGGSGGAADHTFGTAGNSGNNEILIPGGGLKPLDGLHVTLTDVTEVVIFYIEED